MYETQPSGLIPQLESVSRRRRSAIKVQSFSGINRLARLGQERKEFGVGVVLATIQAEQDLSRVRNEYLNIATDYNKAQYALLRALGRLKGF